MSQVHLACARKERPGQLVLTLLGAYDGREFTLHYAGVEIDYRSDSSTPWTEGYLKSFDPRIFFSHRDPRHCEIVAELLGDVVLEWALASRPGSILDVPVPLWGVMLQRIEVLYQRTEHVRIEAAAVETI